MTQKLTDIPVILALTGAILLIAGLIGGAIAWNGQALFPRFTRRNGVVCILVGVLLLGFAYRADRSASSQNGAATATPQAVGQGQASSPPIERGETPTNGPVVPTTEMAPVVSSPPTPTPSRVVVSEEFEVCRGEHQTCVVPANSEGVCALYFYPQGQSGAVIRTFLFRSSIDVTVKNISGVVHCWRYTPTRTTAAGGNAFATSDDVTATGIQFTAPIEPVNPETLLGDGGHQELLGLWEYGGQRPALPDPPQDGVVIVAHGDIDTSGTCHIRVFRTGMPITGLGDGTFQLWRLTGTAQEITERIGDIQASAAQGAGGRCEELP